MEKDMADQKEEAEAALEEMQAALVENQSLMPNSEEEAAKIKQLSSEQPMYVFERMRHLMAELSFLTDIVEDHQFEAHQEVLLVLMEDYTALVELAVARGLV